MAPPEVPLVVAADEEEPYPPPPPLEDSPVVALPEVADPLPEDPPEPAPPQLVSARASTRARAATASVPFIIFSLLAGEVRLAWGVIRCAWADWIAPVLRVQSKLSASIHASS